jgi:hypothetical protein
MSYLDAADKTVILVLFCNLTSALKFRPQTGRHNLNPAITKAPASTAALIAKANANGYRRGVIRSEIVSGRRKRTLKGRRATTT